MRPDYTPLGPGVGFLETCRVQRDTDGSGWLRRLPVVLRCLVWRPGQDEMSDCAWFGITEGMRQAEEAAEAT